ncbi:hypothetical protein Emag_005808 [Eimeria magna]
MSSDDLEKLGPDEFLMSLAAEPWNLHEDPPQQVESAPFPDSGSSADLVLPSPHQQEVPDPKAEDSPAAAPGSSVDPATDDPPEEDELGIPLKMVPGRCPYAWSPPRRGHDRFGFYTGPPLTAQNPVERPIPSLPPNCPFGDPAALIPLRYFAVLPGPGSKAQAMERLWIVKMSFRDVYRESVMIAHVVNSIRDASFADFGGIFRTSFPSEKCSLQTEKWRNGSLRTTVDVGFPLTHFAPNILGAEKWTTGEMTDTTAPPIY